MHNFEGNQLNYVLRSNVTTTTTTTETSVMHLLFEQLQYYGTSTLSTNLVSISSMFYAQLLFAQIPNAQKRQSSH
jgi:hypothetical protein